MTKHVKKLTKKIYSPLFISFFIVLVFLFPHIYAWIFTPEGMVFTGQASWFDPWDINVYVAAINWSQEFGLYFQNAYTTTPHEPIILYPLYTFLGMAFPSSNPWLIYHLSKIVLGVAFALTMYKISLYFLKDKSLSLLCVILASLGGGLGWLFFKLIYIPDISHTPFTFTSTYERPHELLALTLYFSSLYLFYKSVAENDILKSLKSSIVACGFILFYPYYLASYYLIAFLFVLVSKGKSAKKFTKHLITIFSITFPVGILYSLYLLSGGSFKNVLSPDLPTPSPILLILGYGFLTPPLLHQLFMVKNKSSKTIFLNTWFFTSILLAYTPTGFSRYFLRGLFFPGVLLVLLNLDSFSKQARLKKPTFIKILVLTLPITSFFLMFARVYVAHRAESSWYYVSKEKFAAIELLKQNSDLGGGVVINSYPLANHLPTRTHNRVYVGHKFQTPNSKRKREKIINFYQNQLTESQAKKLLEDNNINLVLWSNMDKKDQLFAKESPEYSFLEKIYYNTDTAIYKVAFED